MVKRRILTEYRLMTVLVHGGMMMPERAAWQVYRGPDTRRQIAGWVPPHIVSRLRGADRVEGQAEFPDRLVLRKGLPARQHVARVAPPSDTLAVRARIPKGLADEWLSTPDRVRQRAAAGRFKDIFIHAGQPGTLRLRPVRPDRMGESPAEHMARLEQRLGTPCLQRLEDLLVDRATVSALTIRWQRDAREVRALAGEALSRLAEAYDLALVCASPA